MSLVQAKTLGLTEFNFLRLYISYQYIKNNEIIINKKETEHKLYPYCIDEEYSCLFNNIAAKNHIDGDNYVNLQEGFLDAMTFGFITMVNDVGDMRYIINITSKEEASKIISEYSKELSDKMSKLIDELSLTIKDEKQKVLIRKNED